MCWKFPASISRRELCNYQDNQNEYYRFFITGVVIGNRNGKCIVVQSSDTFSRVLFGGLKQSLVFDDVGKAKIQILISGTQ